MSRKTWFTLLLIFLPFLIGALFSFLAQTFWNPVPLLVFKVDMGMVVFVTGTVVTLFLAVAYLSRRSEEGKATRKTEESLREFEQGRRRFLRRLDHEIKNPLTGLRAALVNLQETNDTGERKRAAENARRAVERLSRLLTALRKLSDLEDRSLERLPVGMPDPRHATTSELRTEGRWRLKQESERFGNGKEEGRLNTSRLRQLVDHQGRRIACPQQALLPILQLRLKHIPQAAASLGEMNGMPGSNHTRLGEATGLVHDRACVPKRNYK